MSASVVAVGIDLGTTNSCVAAVINGQVRTIHNDQGKYVTPSCVSFTENQVLVGEAARVESAINSKNTVFYAKRLIGRSYDDWFQEYKAEQPHWPFTVINQNGKPVFEVKFEERTQHFTPEKISSFVLANLKKAAENVLRQPVTNAVISVPANFNYAQRAATEEAAKLAGLTVLRLCSEPAMAGIVYEPFKNNYDRKRFLVFDCGGGTTDVAILSISQDGTYDVMATAGNMYLGGENIVDRLVNHFLERLRDETGVDYSNNEMAVHHLREKCEECKCQLSHAEAYTVTFMGCMPHKYMKMGRARFNVLNDDIFDKMMEPVGEAIAGAGLTTNDIDEVLLAGGSSRIVEIQHRLSKFFNDKPLHECVNPDESIAQGAALMASALSGDKKSNLLAGRPLREVTPLSLSVSMVHEELSVIVPRNTPLPIEKTSRYYTVLDNQSTLSWGIYEGERALADDCKNGYLGTLTLNNIMKRRRREVYADVTFQVNASGILQVTACEPQSGSKGSLQLMSENRQRHSSSVKAMIADAEKNVEQDAATRQRIAALRAFTDIVYKRKHREEDEKGSNKNVLDACLAEVAWIEKNEHTASFSEIAGRRSLFEAAYVKLG